MIYIITLVNEVLPFVDLRKKSVEVDPLFNEETYPGTSIKRWVAYANYVYQITSNDIVIYETDDMAFRNHVCDNILNFILENRYNNYDTFIDMNDILCETNLQIYEEPGRK